MVELTLPPSPADEADEASVASLLRTYAREIALPAGAVRTEPWSEAAAARSPSILAVHWRAPWQLRSIRLERTSATLWVLLDPPTLTGDDVYHAPCIFVPAAGPAHVLDAIALAQVIARELGGEVHPEFFRLVADSVRVQRVLNGARARRDAPGALVSAGPAADFLAAEQDLLYGHLFHPSPKSRQGFSDEDLVRYAPELRARFALHYFAARPDHLLQGSILPESCAALLAARPGPPTPAGLVRIPLHPWQARHVRGLAAVRSALARGELLDLGTGGPEFFATSSVRTVFAPAEPFLYKLSLGVRITNCLRRNAPHEMEAAVCLSGIWRAHDAAMRAQFPGFRVLLEPAFAALDLETREREVTEGFGLLLRENPFAARDPLAGTPLLAGAVFGPDPARLNALISRSGQDPIEWFRDFASHAIPPLLHALCMHGVMFEPHLQNVLLTVRDGRVVGVVLRDLDNAKLVAEIAAPDLTRDLSPSARAEITYDQAHALPRFVYCLMVNHLCAAVAALAAHDRTRELDLWRVVRETLAQYLDARPSPTAAALIEPLLAGEPFPAKANLLTRVRKTPDRDAPYRPVPNPLAQARRA